MHDLIFMGKEKHTDTVSFKKVLHSPSGPTVGSSHRVGNCSPRPSNESFGDKDLHLISL